MSKCDICDKEKPDDQIYFGRWITYCESCKEQGKKKDFDLAFENEISPALIDGDINSIDGELAEQLINNI